jgi:outer membrane protein assembly factor BamB
LNAEDGTMIWEYDAKTIIWTSPAVTENRIYFGGLNGIFYCLDSYDGKLIWTYETDKGIWSSPAVSDDKVYFGSNDNFIYCLDVDNGNKIWSYDTKGEVHSSPAVAYGNVYIGSSFQGLFCFNEDTGNVEWKYLFDNGIWSPPSIADGKVYFGTYHCCGAVSYVYCVDAYNKDLIWNYQTTCIMGISSSPAIAAGKVFISLDDGEILAFGNDEELYADANGPYFSLIDSQIQFKGSAYGGKPDYNWFWDFGDGNSSTQQNPTHTYSSLGEFNIVLTVTDDENTVSIDHTKANIEEIPQNNPPTLPTINGPTQGKINEKHDFILRSKDIDGDDIYYILDWGDGSHLDHYGPYQNDIDVLVNHTWSEQGDYTLKCKVKDIHDLESDWSSFNLNIPRTNFQIRLFQFRYNFILKILKPISD